jgi:hypothetical protein
MMVRGQNRAETESLTEYFSYGLLARVASASKFMGLCVSNEGRYIKKSALTRNEVAVM